MAQRGFEIGENGQRVWRSVEDVHQLLSQGKIVHFEMIPWSSNYTFVARLAVEDLPTFLAVYKPRRGEIPLYDFPDGTLYKRERAAYVTGRALGWDFIPPTVIRDGPHGVGSVQLFIDAEPKSDYFRFKDEHLPELQRMALFDVITNNADRKAGHCLKARDGKIWGIDHGLTFNTAPKLRTVIWDFAGDPVPAALLRQLRSFRDNSARLGSLKRQLDSLIALDEYRVFLKRVDAVLESGRYPMMHSRRAVPWPWF